MSWVWEVVGEGGLRWTSLATAAQKDVRQSANEEAIAHSSRGLALLKAAPDVASSPLLEFSLQMSLAAALIATKSWGAPEVGQALARARELTEQLADHPELLQGRNVIYQYYLVRAEHRTALKLAQLDADAGERAGGDLAFPFPLRFDSRRFRRTVRASGSDSSLETDLAELDGLAERDGV